MDTLTTILTFVSGLVVRLIIPVAVTLVFIWALRKLDQRWQSEAQEENLMIPVRNPGCWKVNKCSAEARAKCSAYAHPETPCWQHFRERNGGMLEERCIGCKVFKEAPVPLYV